MRAAIPILIPLAALLVAGCPNQQVKESIEKMNEGVLKARRGNYETAILDLKDATRIYRDNHQAWSALGQIYSKQKQWEKAVEALSEAVRVESDVPRYQMLLGIAHYESGNSSLAATHLEKTIEIENRLAPAYYYLGRIYEDSDEPAKAAEAWSQAARIDPKEGNSFVRLGKLYLLWDMIDQAISVLEQGALHVKGEERTNVFHHLGLAYDAKGNWDSSIEAYSQAIDADSGNLDAKFQRGLAHARKGAISEAKKDLEEYSKAGNNPYNKQEANKVLFTLISQ